MPDDAVKLKKHETAETRRGHPASRGCGGPGWARPRLQPRPGAPLLGLLTPGHDLVSPPKSRGEDPICRSSTGPALARGLDSDVTPSGTPPRTPVSRTTCAFARAETSAQGARSRKQHPSPVSYVSFRFAVLFSRKGPFPPVTHSLQGNLANSNRETQTTFWAETATIPWTTCF